MTCPGSTTKGGGTPGGGGGCAPKLIFSGTPPDPGATA